MFAVAVAATAVLAWCQFSEPTAAGGVALSSQAPTRVAADEDGSKAVTASQAATMDREEEEEKPLTSDLLSTPATGSASPAGSPSPVLASGIKPHPASSKLSDTDDDARGNGLIGYVDEKCGPSGATAKPTKSSGPNGSQEWLNCGLSMSEPDSPWVRCPAVGAVLASLTSLLSDSAGHQTLPAHDHHTRSSARNAQLGLRSVQTVRRLV